MASWKSVLLFNGVNSSKAMAALDDYQAVWVDGKDNSVARRVIIDSGGNVFPSVIGMEAPKRRATFTGLTLSEDNDEGTGIKRGKVLLMCYTYTNKEGVESNPSPISVLDDVQYMAKGSFTKDGQVYLYPVQDGTYNYSPIPVGSIKSINITVPITVGSVDQINVYLAEADYTETSTPSSNFRHVLTQKVPSGVTSVSAMLSAIPSILTANYENDIAPRGDDITLADGVPFVANAVNTLGFPSAPLSIWEITINNANPANYVNRYHRIDLFDATGIKPAISNYLSGIDWDTEDLDDIRIMDSDMITPLDVFHYPVDSVLKYHKDVEIAGEDGVYASLIAGDPNTPSAMLLTAKSVGAAGNDITLTAEYDKDVSVCGEIVAQSGVDVMGITLTSVTGQYWVVLNIVKPDNHNETLSVAKTSDGDKVTIEIELETANTSGYPAVSTMQEISDLLQAEILEGGALDGTIASVTEEGDWDGSHVFSDYPYISAFINVLNAVTVIVTGTNIVVRLPFNPITELSGASVASVVAAINNTADSSALVTASLYIPGSFGYFQTIVTTNLAGGDGGTAVAATDQIQTRMMAYVRIPVIPANSSKSIYLVRFEPGGLPSGYEGRFRKLILGGTPGTNDILLEDFYANHVEYNPIRSGEVLFATREVVPAIVDESLRFDYAIKNAANQWTARYRTETDLQTEDLLTPENDPYVKISIYDEYGAATGVVRRMPARSAMGYMSPTNVTTPFVLSYTINPMMTTFPRKGHISGWASIPAVADDTASYQGTLVGISAVVSATNFQAMGGINIIINTIGDGLIWVGISIQGQPIFYPENFLVGRSGSVPIGIVGHIFCFVSWEINAERELKYSAALYAYGKYYEVIDCTSPAAIDTSLLCRVDKGIIAQRYDEGMGSPKMYIFPHAITVDASEYINSAEHILNIARFMPYYPVSGIGAYSQIVATDEDTPQLCYNNENITIEVVNLERDNRPGRVQWGSYQGMPDLNEYPMNENILRIIPIKSFMPTDEHNTILIFTAKRDVYRLALFGDSADSCRVIRELVGNGLRVRDGLCVIQDGLAWLSKDGMVIMTQNGIREVGKGYIDLSGATSLVYDYERNWLWARGTSHTYVYQVNEKVWWESLSGRQPDLFIAGIDGEEGWLSYDNLIMYRSSGEASVGAYKTRLVTRAFRVAKKLGRFMLNTTLTSVAYKFYLYLHSPKIASTPAVTAEYSGMSNVRTSVPHASADFVQIDLQSVDNVVNIELENIDGR